MGRDLLIDKYRPQSLDELSYNLEANAFFKSIAQKTDMPHLIIEGPRGCGKRLRVELYLKEKYGNFRTNSGIINLEVPGKNETKPVHAIYSKYHHQFNPSLHNIYDRSLIQCFIAEIVQTRLLVNIPYRIIIIEDADLLSTEAQESLRRTLETLVKSCRFIFIVNNDDRMIAPIYSRCICVKMAAPTITEMVDIMQKICIAEDRSDISLDNLTRLANGSGRDLHKAYNMLNKLLLSDTRLFSIHDYDNVYRYCAEIVDTLIKGQTIVGAIEDARSLLYELVNFCVNSGTLIPILLNITLDKLPQSAHSERFYITQKASERDLSVRNSSKDIYHVESFCLHIFKVVKILMLTKQRQTPVIKKKK